MKVKELIEQLQKQDPEKDVYIQQGEELAYMAVHTVRGKELYDDDGYFRDDDPEEAPTINAVVIEYN